MSQLSPIYTACSLGQSVRVKDLLSQGADANWQDPKGFSCLHVSINNGNADCMEILVNKGNANTNIKDKGFFFFFFFF